MSVSSRIHGSGAGSSGFDRRDPSRGDVARFREGRSPGDTVRGVFLRLETADLGWFRLEGEELLASLPADAARLTPGDAALFIIDALEPEPVLRFLHLIGPEGRPRFSRIV